LTPADGPEVAVKAMASGAMVHPCEFFDFCILQRCGLGQGTGKVLFPAKKSKTPFLTWTV
jgi:hypothetical protein